MTHTCTCTQDIHFKMLLAYTNHWTVTWHIFGILRILRLVLLVKDL